MLGRIVSIALTASGASLIATQSTYCQRRQHFGAQHLVEHRTARALVDEAVGGDGDDQHVAELAGGFEMADMAEMQQIECPCACTTVLPACAQLLRDGGDLGERADLVARAGRARLAAAAQL